MFSRVDLSGPAGFDAAVDEDELLLGVGKADFSDKGSGCLKSILGFSKDGPQTANFLRLGMIMFCCCAW